MAQLDPLLRALVDQKAHELLLDDGKQPAFRFGDRCRAVSKTVLTQNQITILLAELADQVESAKVARGEPAEFVYRHPGGQPFVCRVQRHAGTLQARVTPQTNAGTPAAETPPSPRTPSTPKVTTSQTVPPAPRPVESPPPGPGRDVEVASEAEVASEVTPRAEVARSATASVGDEDSIDGYLKRMVQAEASDLHLSAGETPLVRVHGEMCPLPGARPLAPAETARLLEAMMPERNRGEFRETHDTDFGYEIAGLARFRANVFMDRKGTGGVFRVIPSEILTAEQLRLPPAILDLCTLSKGLVLVTGPTGSGKSTTLAAMIDHINKTRNEHIITIEDPIEFVHSNQRCLVNQREVITHTAGFKTALRAALREDPDIVLVGELRDLETIAIAIETAETGHLVFGTLHTTTACSTVDRIIDQFPADRQQQIRTMLASSLRAVVAQTLLRKTGGGRVAALEILMVNPAISNLVREGKTFQIPSLMQTGRSSGMRLLNDAMLELVTSNLVDPTEAYIRAVDKTGFASMLVKAGIRIEHVES